MQRVKSSANKSTEKILVSYFKTHHIKGWRRQYPVIGKPDFVFTEQKIAVFVDGCFWHGHNCRNVTPQQNSEYWQNKQRRNKERDIEITNRFAARGWTVIRIWECQLDDKNLTRIFEALQVGFGRMSWRGLPSKR